MRPALRLLLASMILLVLVAPPALAQDAAGEVSRESLGNSSESMTLTEFEQTQEKPWYNSDYLFALSRSLGDSTMNDAAKAPLFIVTVVCDVVLLIPAAIGGFFG